MALIPVSQQQPVFKAKRDREGPWLQGAQALGGAMVAASPLISTAGAAGAPATGGGSLALAGGLLAAGAALRSATRPTPSQGSYQGGSTGAPLVAMSQRLDSMKGDPYAQMVQARAALDQIPMDYETKIQYAKPLDEAMYAYQQRYSRGSV